MRKSIIILDKSELSHNMIATMLNDRYFLESARHIEDIDVLLRERDWSLIVINANVYDEKRWAAMLRRNPTVAKLPKIFIGFKNIKELNALFLQRPFHPTELIAIIIGLLMSPT